MGIAVDAVLLQGMRGIEDTLDRVEPVLLFAFRHIVAGEAEIIEDAARIGPLPEQVVVLEEMIVTDGGMRHDERLHRHGIFFHDVADDTGWS